MTRQFLRAAFPLSLFLLSVVPVVAQAPTEPPAPYQPPAIRFDAKGLTLLDAVKLTLQHDPNIKLREADTDLQAGQRCAARKGRSTPSSRPAATSTADRWNCSTASSRPSSRSATT